MLYTANEELFKAEQKKEIKIKIYTTTIEQRKQQQQQQKKKKYRKHVRKKIMINQ